MTTVAHIDELLSADMIIGDTRSPTGSGGTYDHINPSTGLVQAQVPLAGEAEVDAAVSAARAAFSTWKTWNPAERRRLLARLAELLKQNSEKFASIQALETGIPISTGGMLGMLIDWTEYAASCADKLAGEVIPTEPSAQFDYTLLEPIGVVGVLIPWNGPVGQIGISVIAPLAAGCCVVVKPSELAPFSSTLFADLCLEAGIPPGVVNVLAGTGAAGEALVKHPGIDKISFVGGVPTSRVVAATAAQHGKPVLLELGGKSADIVFDDADVERAAAEAIGWLVFNCGQACTLASRFIVHDSIYDEYVSRVATAMTALRVGNASETSTQLGPLINQAARDRVLGFVDRAKGSAASLVAGGATVDGAGFFMQPTLFADVDNSSEIAQHEIFGPVLAVIRFSHEDEAIAIANDSQYGLAAYVHTSNLARAIRVTHQLDAGNVGVNGGIAPAMAAAPFGGVKSSGYGRAGGMAGLREFTRVKNVMIHL